MSAEDVVRVSDALSETEWQSMAELAEKACVSANLVGRALSIFGEERIIERRLGEPTGPKKRTSWFLFKLKERRLW